MARVLERHGWRHRSTRGSHHVYVKAGRRETISIPIHGNRDLKKGLLERLMKIAELTEDDLR